MTEKTQGDATTRDPCEGSRGDDFSRVQKCARHSGIMPAESLFAGWDAPSRGTENIEALDRERGGQKKEGRDRKEKEGRERG